MGEAVWVHHDGDSGSGVSGFFADSLSDLGFHVCGLDEAAAGSDGVILTEAPASTGAELVRDLGQRRGCRICVVVLSGGESDRRHHWGLLRAGASEVLSGACEPDSVAALAARLRRWHEVDRLVRSPLVRENLIGTSPVWQGFLRALVEAAVFTEFPILLMGESGTGKELAARLVHSLDPRPDKKDVVILDCTTITPELSGSEFFGHERGAFTGATGPRNGAFALADGGTLFLDEIGELPLSMQAQLLRVVQERQFKRVGGNQWLRTRFRLVCATNRVLHDEVQADRFRADLYYRIATCVLHLPPLRERPDDIIPLARHFLSEATSANPPSEIGPAVQQLLQARRYPGNVRELRQLMGRIAARHVGSEVTVGDIPESEWPEGDLDQVPWTGDAFESAIRHALCLGVKLKDIGQAATETAIRIAVGDEDGNLQRAAKRLGVTDRALQMRRANRRG